MTPDNRPTAENKRIVVQFLATFSTGDVPGLLDWLHPEATWWVAGRMAGISGSYNKQELGDLLQGAKSAYKEGALRIVPAGMVAEGNYVAVEAESYAELSDGRVYNNLYHFLFEIQDGKIKRVKEFMDTKHAEETFLV